MKNGIWKLVYGKLSKPPLSKVEEVIKWEEKAEQAAGEIYLLVENDQRVHFRGKEDDPVEMWRLLEMAHLSKKPGARFNAYNDLFSIRKQDSETLMDLGVRIEKAIQAIQNLRTRDFTIKHLNDDLQFIPLLCPSLSQTRHLPS